MITYSHAAPRRAGAVLALACLTGLAAACGSSGGTSATAADLPDNHADLVAAAEDEGKVVLGAGGHTRPHAQLLKKEFEAKYDIDVTFVRQPSGKIAQQVEAQLTAGSAKYDAISLNDQSTLARWAGEDLLAHLKLPDRDRLISKVDSKSTVPYVPFTWQAVGYSYNSAQVSESELSTTWKELAEQDAVFAHGDPRASGAAFTFVAGLSQAGVAEPFYSELGQHEVLVTDSSASQLTQLLATGEAHYGFPGAEASIYPAMKSGQPVAMAYPDGLITLLPSFTAILVKAPHPAAAQLFVQFQLSKQFQQAQTGIGLRSVLESVPAPEGLKTISEDRLARVDMAKALEREDSILRAYTENIGR